MADQKDARRGIFVYIKPDGRIGHEGVGDPILNDAEVLGLGQYIASLISIKEAEDTRGALAKALTGIVSSIGRLLPEIPSIEEVKK